MYRLAKIHIIVSIIINCRNFIFESDIDECDINNGGCSHNCTNTNGSYSCTCNSGYTLASDQTTCTDGKYIITRKYSVVIYLTHRWLRNLPGLATEYMLTLLKCLQLSGESLLPMFQPCIGYIGTPSFKRSIQKHWMDNP
jgi:hypothetical protein